MFDITRYSSLRNFTDWIEIFKKGYKGENHQLPVLMVGSKLDLEYKRAVSREDAFDIAKDHNLFGYIECSSKDGQNVPEIFQEISRLMLLKAGLM